MATKPQKAHDVDVSIAQCAALLGVAHPTVLRWIKGDGFPVQSVREGHKGSKVNMPKAIEWYANRRVAKELAYFKGRIAELEGDRSTNVSTHDMEKTKLLIAQRKKAELEHEVLSGKQVSYDDFVASASEAMAIISAYDDSLAGRLASDLSVMTDPALIRQKLLEEIRNNRREASLRLQDWARVVASGEDTASAAEANAV